MKFAKELEQELVPEWRLKYLDYKGGKKRIKDISRALAKINQSPRLPKAMSKTNAHTPFSLFNTVDDGGVRTPPDAQETLAEQLLRVQTADSRRSGGIRSSPRDGRPPSVVEEREGGRRKSKSSQGRVHINERSPLRDTDATTQTGNYGSIGSAPVMKPSPVGPPSLELPDPALHFEHPLQRARSNVDSVGNNPQMRRHSTVAGDQYEVGRTHTPSKISVGKLPKRRNIFHPRRTFSMPYGQANTRRPFFQNLFSHHKPESPRHPDAPLEAYREFDLAQARFFNFLDKEFEKVESFYKLKEQEATDRFEKLHEQLRIMRDRRVHELLAAQRQHQVLEQHHHEPTENGNDQKKRPSLVPLQSGTLEAGRDFLRPIEQVVGLHSDYVGKNSKALQDMVAQKARGEDPNDINQQGWRDYSRHPVAEDVPYRVAKRKLKLALQEYYRGLELLKSYALLNRTAFRKINKKYDKAVMARPPYRYMAERVNKAWFVVSERLERLIVDCEDLYTRYFERGNHKLAVNKLRSKIGKGSHSSAVFRNGLMLATGAILGTQGAVAGFYINQDDSQPERGLWASYILQLYGGYSLALLLFLLFALDCRQWTKSKINYVFIFEFDTRHVLDWRQLIELPCLFTLILGLTMFVNFHPASPPNFFLWWPVVLIGITVIIMFFPMRIFYWKSRGWLIYSLWRLIFAGLYSVEFRDFFLGDMFCSLTYTMGNIEVFFCLYSQQWSNPEMCNSSNSRLLGFFSTLPGIWRALQCVRRYWDTRNLFPHLVNCGKYTCTIAFYAMLSMYRIHRTYELYILFIFVGVLNSIYVSIWDLVMDWSLCNPYAPKKFLRKDLGYKHVSFYYTAMVIDPILRFNWLMYVVLPVELQQSALLSYLISVSEVLRRAMWSLIRVENEHCTNVGRFRASRDVPLPYELENDSEASSLPIDGDPAGELVHSPARTAEASIGAPATPGTPAQPPHTANPLARTSTVSSRPSPLTLRRRQTLPAGRLEDGTTTGSETPRKLNRVGAILASAHAEDFERRKKPGTVPGVDSTPEPNSAKLRALEVEEASSDEEEEEEMQVESARLMDDQAFDERESVYRAELAREHRHTQTRRRSEAAAERARARGEQLEREEIEERGGHVSLGSSPRGALSLRVEALREEEEGETSEAGRSSKAQGKAPQRDRDE